MIVAGIGCKDGATPQAVVEAITMAVDRCDLTKAELKAIAISASFSEASVIEVARAFALPLIFVAPEAMTGGGTKELPPDVFVLRTASGMAERAALTAAGPTARLLGPPVSLHLVTCAVAKG